MPTPKQLYLDYASAAPLDSSVERLMAKLNKQLYANASSAHSLGRASRTLLEEARTTIARVLGAKSEEIIFTGSGTEANNLALLGLARAHADKGQHIISSTIEHSSILQALRQLEREGFSVTYLEPDAYGLISPQGIKKALRSDTILISIGYANNEIGTIQPIRQIAKLLEPIKKAQPGQLPLLHTDACQAVGALNINVRQLGVDAMTINSAKIYGPKGIAALYKRRSLVIKPLMYGGDQERGVRPGTENVLLAVAFARALTIAEQKKISETKRLTKLRDMAIASILKACPKARLNGHPTQRLANNLNISFSHTDGERLMLMLDQQGIAVSTGSACTASSNEPSHVIEALKLPADYARGNLRITLGRQTKKKDLEYFIKVLTNVLT